jgi:hypothetical protein
MFLRMTSSQIMAYHGHATRAEKYTALRLTVAKHVKPRHTQQGDKMFDINENPEGEPREKYSRKGVEGGFAKTLAREAKGISDKPIAMHVQKSEFDYWWKQTALLCDLRGLDEVRQLRCRHDKRITDHCSVVECPKRRKY